MQLRWLVGSIQGNIGGNFLCVCLGKGGRANEERHVSTFFWQWWWNLHSPNSCPQAPLPSAYLCWPTMYSLTPGSCIKLQITVVHTLFVHHYTPLSYSHTPYNWPHIQNLLFIADHHFLLCCRRLQVTYVLYCSGVQVYMCAGETCTVLNMFIGVQTRAK